MSEAIVQTLALVLLVAIVLGVLARVLVRRDSRLADPVRLTSQLITHIGVAVLFGWTAVRLAHDDDALHLVIAGVLGLLAVGLVLIAALLVWGFFRFSSGEHK